MRYSQLRCLHSLRSSHAVANSRDTNPVFSKLRGFGGLMGSGHPGTAESPSEVFATVYGNGELVQETKQKMLS